jgi:uncharacterized protein (DUF1697 family)
MKPMAKYVALLRGIGPGNPNMRNDKLRRVFEAAGFSNVRSVISSGNIVFESDRTDIPAIETEIEQAIATELGFTTTAIVRSQAQLQALVDANPYGDLTHAAGTYLLVTFFKKPTRVPFELPYQPGGKPYQLLRVVDNTLFTVSDNTNIKTNDVMVWLEKEFSKAISSRTWLTIRRILLKFDQDA